MVARIRIGCGAVAFDLELLKKKHTYATGGIVIVGGLGVFFVLSRGGSSAPASASAGNSDAEYAATLQAQSQMAQLSAATPVTASQQTQAQLSVAQLQAGVANNQIDAQQETTDKANEYALASSLISANASVLENANNLAAATTQQTNELQYAQNIQSMQDSVLTDQINEGYAARQRQRNAIGRLGRHTGISEQCRQPASWHCESRIAGQYNVGTATIG